MFAVAISTLKICIGSLLLHDTEDLRLKTVCLVVWYPVSIGGLDFEYAHSPCQLFCVGEDLIGVCLSGNKLFFNVGVLPHAKKLFPFTMQGEQAYAKFKAPIETGLQTT